MASLNCLPFKLFSSWLFPRFQAANQLWVEERGFLSHLPRCPSHSHTSLLHHPAMHTSLMSLADLNQTWLINCSSGTQDMGGGRIILPTMVRLALLSRRELVPQLIHSSLSSGIFSFFQQEDETLSVCIQWAFNWPNMGFLRLVFHSPFLFIYVWICLQVQEGQG